MCFSFLRFTAWVIIDERLRFLFACLAERRWGREKEGEKGAICDVEGMEAAAAKALVLRGALLLLQRRALDAVDAGAAGDAQMPCTPLTVRIFEKREEREKRRRKGERCEIEDKPPPHGRKQKNPTFSHFKKKSCRAEQRQQRRPLLLLRRLSQGAQSQQQFRPRSKRQTALLVQGEMKSLFFLFFRC